MNSCALGCQASRQSGIVGEAWSGGSTVLGLESKPRWHVDLPNPAREYLAEVDAPMIIVSSCINPKLNGLASQKAC